ERFADHAVSVAKRVVYLVTGEHADEIQQAEAPGYGRPGAGAVSAAGPAAPCRAPPRAAPRR
ncbi:hypothetical protein AB0P45_17030, partial [Streptomyces niveus]